MKLIGGGLKKLCSGGVNEVDWRWFVKIIA